MVHDDFEINFWVCSHPLSLLNEINEADEVCNCFSCKYCHSDQLNLMMILEEEKVAKQTNYYVLGSRICFANMNIWEISTFFSSS